MRKLSLLFVILLSSFIIAQNGKGIESDNIYPVVYDPVVITPTLLPETVIGTFYPAGTYASMPDSGWGGAAAWLGDTLYHAFSNNVGGGTNRFFKYTLNGSWTESTLPEIKAGSSLTAANGKLYLIGGGATVTAGSNTTYEYNPATGDWSAKAIMPAALSGHGTVNWGDSVLIVVGGPWSGSGTNLNVHYYRINTDTWGTITGSLPAGQGRRSFAMGLAGGNKIVIAAGFNTAFLSTAWVGTIGADASQITWAAAPNLPIYYPGLSRPGGVGFDNTFIVACGERGGVTGHSDSAYVFDVNSNSWIGVINGKSFPASNLFNVTTAKNVGGFINLFITGGTSIVGGTTFIKNNLEVATTTIPVIPVELSSFTYSVTGNDVQLIWSTASELNNSGFEIQKSTGTSEYKTIGFIAGNGTTTNTSNYSFVDKDVTGKTYYRLKQIDFDGSFEFSNAIEVDVDMPSAYVLHQNYPNPFNPSTSIKYQIPVTMEVSLKVYDVMGNEVSELVNGVQDAGMHLVQFDASKLSSGVYFYTLKTGEFTQSKRMLLVK